MQFADTVPIISIVNLESVSRAWTHCAHFLDTAIRKARGEMLLSDVRKACLDGNMQLWVVFTSKPEFLGAAVTQVVGYPRFDALRIVLLGGKRFDAWRDKLDAELVQAAKRAGCRRLEAFGRAGFVRSLQGLGYDRLYVAIGKEVECPSQAE